MRAVTGAPWRALHRTGAGAARRWRAVRLARRTEAWVLSEPVAGCVGIAFMLCAVLLGGGAYLARHDVPGAPYLMLESAVAGAVGAGLFLAAHLVRRRRR